MGKRAMISQTKDAAALLAALDRDPYYNLYARAYLSGYPCDDSFYRAFTLPGGSIVLHAGTAHVTGNAACDREELAAFVRMLGAREVFAPAGLPLFLPGYRAAQKELLVFDGTAPGVAGGQMAQEQQLPEIYALLCQAFANMPDFPEFRAAKTAQRFYLGGATAVCLEGDTVAATASVLVRAGDAALLGAVATAPAARGKGYAGAALSLLINRLLDGGCVPAILCDNPAAIRLYHRLGFQDFGKMTVYEHVL